MMQLARETSLSQDGNSTLDTLLKATHALGLRLTVASESRAQA